MKLILKLLIFFPFGMLLRFWVDYIEIVRVVSRGEEIDLGWCRWIFIGLTIFPFFRLGYHVDRWVEKRKSVSLSECR
jgi:hypothetical protein